MRYILGVKEGDHAFLFQQVAEAEQAGRVTYYERHDRQQGVHHRFRFVGDMPLNESHTNLRVNRVLGDGRGQSPAFQLGDGPVCQQGHGLPPYAGRASSLAN